MLVHYIRLVLNFTAQRLSARIPFTDPIISHRGGLPLYQTMSSINHFIVTVYVSKIGTIPFTTAVCAECGPLARSSEYKRRMNKSTTADTFDDIIEEK